MAGYIVLNEHYIKYDDGNYKNQIDIFLHELMHVLAFDIDLYKSFPKNSNDQDFFKEDEYGDFYLQGDHTLSFVKDHFECDDIPGGIYKSSLIKAKLSALPTGSPDPHLSRITFGEEIMTPIQGSLSIFSKLTLAVLRDSGWYQVDMDTAEEYYYGQGSGCNVIELDCLDPEYPLACEDKERVRCSEDLRFLEMCQKEANYSDCWMRVKKKSCQVQKYLNDFFAVFSGSRYNLSDHLGNPL